MIHRSSFCCIQCQPDLFLQRGKLFITSSGRILCWSLKVRQSRRIFDASSIDYDVAHQVQVYHVMNLCEINFSYDDTFHHIFCVCRSCRSYQTGLNLAFHHYQHQMHARHSFLRSYDSSHYFASIRSFLSTITHDYWPKTLPLNSALDHNIRIIGEASNLGYDPHVPLLSLENLSQLMSKILVILSQLGSQRCQWLPAKASEDSKYRRSSVAYHLNDTDPSKLQQQVKKYDLLESFEGYEPVEKPTGEISSLSLKWVPLSPNEEIISSYGILPKFTFNEYMLTIATLGIYYCFCGGRSMLRRHLAYILTTHRIIEVYLQVRYTSCLVSL